MATLVPDLPDELVHEILFRLPPDEPACLFRLSVLSNLWRSLLSDPGFHHNYRKFNRMPPMLGFIYNSEVSSVSRFVPTTGSSLPCTFDPQLADFTVCDCRHGRVLLDNGEVPMELVVWDPMTDRRKEVSDPRRSLFYLGTAVLCAVDGCDHTSCHKGPFHVVFVGIDAEVGSVTAYKYSSETGEWSTPTSELALVDEHHFVVELDLFDGLDPVDDGYLTAMHSVLVEDSLHFLLMSGPQGARVLKYDVGRHYLSLIVLPAAAAVYDRGTLLMATEDGRLGVAHLDKLSLHLWSREVGPDGIAAWTEHRVINLIPFLPIGDPAIKVELIGSVEGANIIFATTALGVYAIDLKLLRSRKLCEGQDIRPLFPFMSFYNPPERQTGASFPAGASVAARHQ
ncbi:uncharacterized protein [Lolium perenne]|uniref:uncharacterized protein n=1 Tax=Lolium perenne TaxID=4522 RepID=UPI0021F508EA|nr:uncharacterized protein LOC127320811 [Lolium perenne]XP_051205851.1 uncharacterized protein LOC127320811 [Lolium perenne]